MLLPRIYVFWQFLGVIAQRVKRSHQVCHVCLFSFSCLSVLLSCLSVLLSCLSVLLVLSVCSLCLVCLFSCYVCLFSCHICLFSSHVCLFSLSCLSVLLVMSVCSPVCLFSLSCLSVLLVMSVCSPVCLFSLSCLSVLLVMSVCSPVCLFSLSCLSVLLSCLSVLLVMSVCSPVMSVCSPVMSVCSSVMSVCSPVCNTPTGRNSLKFHICNFYEDLSKNSKIWSKLRNIRHLYEDVSTFIFVTTLASILWLDRIENRSRSCLSVITLNGFIFIITIFYSILLLLHFVYGGCLEFCFVVILWALFIDLVGV